MSIFTGAADRNRTHVGATQTRSAGALATSATPIFTYYHGVQLWEQLTIDTQTLTSKSGFPKSIREKEW